MYIQINTHIPQNNCSSVICRQHNKVSVGSRARHTVPMDLLSEGSSSDSGEGEGKGGTKEESSSRIVSKKRPRVQMGSVDVVASDEIPVGLFQRTVPHRRGHWAGHILIPLIREEEENHPISRLIQKSIRQFKRTLESQGYSGTIVRHSHLHISLSKYFSLQLHFIESFVSRLTQLLSLECSTRVLIDSRNPFLLVNDEKIRSFWCWRVHPASALQKILSHVDTILKDYNQPTYYEPPVFHISLASFGGDLTDLSLPHPSSEEATTPDDDDDAGHDSDSESSEETDAPLLVVDQVVCQFGTTKTYTINLSPVL